MELRHPSGLSARLQSEDGLDRLVIWLNLSKKPIIQRILESLKQPSNSIPRVWLEVVQAVLNLSRNIKLIAEVYPSEAGNIRGTLEEEIDLLEREHGSSDVYLREMPYRYGLPKFIFSVSDVRDLERILFAYYEHYQLATHLFEGSSKQIEKFASDLMDTNSYDDPHSLEHLMREHQVVSIVAGFAGKEMSVISSWLNGEELLHIAEYIGFRNDKAEI